MQSNRSIEPAGSSAESAAGIAVERLFMRNLLAHPTVRVFFKDRESRFLCVSAGWLSSLAPGRSLEEVIGKTDSDIFSGPHAAAALEDEQRVIATGEPMIEKVECETFRDRPDLWVSTTKLPLRDEQENIIGTWGISRDITPQVNAEHALFQQTLTLRSIIDNTPALVYVKGRDYRYQLVNREFEETFGVRSGWIVGRTDEDLLAASALDQVRAKDRAVLDGGQTVQEEETALHDGHERVYLTSRFPLRDSRGEVQAVCVMSTDITERRLEEHTRRERLECSERIHSALAQDRFVLYGQPIVNLASMEVEQAELLIRMLRVRNGGDLVAPAGFLPCAERFDLIQLIDEWVIDRGVALAAAGHRVEVNVSLKTMCDPERVGLIESAVLASHAPPENLIFEITETAAAGNFEAARDFAVRLRKLGCAFALDDFGVGHGAFSYLRHMPVDYLKIDMQFVRNLVSEEEDRQIVRAIVSVAKQFEIKTIAEGVEDGATLNELCALGVDYAQGYWTGRPMPLSQLWKLPEYRKGGANVAQARARQGTESDRSRTGSR
ncbi:MAG: EAL domain-containing protein [Solirubrobacteraceae bacterium]